jgi:RNA polymerase sigma factor (sigma-70 family)
MMEPNHVLGSHKDVSDATPAAEMTSPAGSGEETFDEFYRRQYEVSMRLAWLLTGSKPAAEDVVQDAMSAVYHAFERIERPEPYLRRAVVNRAKSRGRDERRHRERLVLLARDKPVLEPADSRLLELVRELPYRQRVVIITRYWGGWSEAEIAGALGCRPGTVKSLASRALSSLRAEVHE